MSDKITNVARLLAINVVILTAGLHLTETFLASRDPAPSILASGYRDGVMHNFGQRIILNKHIFRERDFAVPKPKGVYRIMVLGDSFTWGVGLSREERYPDIIGDLFRIKCPGRVIEVLNFGYVGHNTVTELEDLVRFKDMVQPDRIVVGFCYNDLEHNSGATYSQSTARFREEYGIYMDLFVAKMDLCGLAHIKTEADNVLRKVGLWTGKIERWEIGVNRMYEDNAREWGLFVDSLSGIKKIADAMGNERPVFAVLTQAVHSDRVTVYENPDKLTEYFLKWYAKAEKAASDRGFITVNFIPEYKLFFKDTIPFINRVDNHPSAELNKVYGNKLFHILAEPICKTSN